MKTNESVCRFHRTALALAACMVCTLATAQIKIEEGLVSVGVGAVNGGFADRSLFSQSNGLNTDRGALGFLDFDYTLRDEAAFKWVDISGRNLLGDIREFSYVRKVPGNWKATFNYSEQVHRDPNVVNTGMIGAGTTTPQIVALVGSPGTGADTELSLKRKNLGIGYTRWITPAMQMEVSLNSEQKSGARLSGVGMNCISAFAPGCAGPTGIATGWATLMAPEPVDANHTQIEARLNYAFEKLRFNLGYYGSFYRNDNGSVTPGVPSSLNNPVGALLPLSTGLQAILARPIALAPDNESHQLDVNGSYDLTPTTRGTFKLSRSWASQDDSFAGAGLSGAPAGVGSLGGDVVTDLMKLGIVSRPIPKLVLLADLRYENRDDNTPIATYNTIGTLHWTNRDLPLEKTHGKLQATWQFSSAYKGSIGVDLDDIDRGVFTQSSAALGVNALRQKTHETTYNAELRRRMTEDFSGAVSLSSSSRDGSDWLKSNGAVGGVTAVANPLDPLNGFLPTAIFMPTLADRKRDKIKLSADWQPSKQVSVQFNAVTGSDSFNTPTVYGLRDTDMNQIDVDVTYTPSYAWSWNAYVSRGEQTLNQARAIGEFMAFSNTNLGVGLGVIAKLSGQLELGGNLSYVDDRNEYVQTLDATAGAFNIAQLAAAGGLPDITFRQTALNLFGRYALNKRSAVRVDLVYQETKYNDWAWGYNGVPYTYSDGTTVSQQAKQSVGLIGVTYQYQWK